MLSVTFVLKIKISRALLYAALAGYALWVVFPMVWVAYSSLKSDREIFTDAFALPSADVARITELLLTDTPGESDIADAMGEIINIVAGGVKTHRLASLSFTA